MSGQTEYGGIVSNQINMRIMKKIYLMIIAAVALLVGCTEKTMDPAFAADEFYIHSAGWTKALSVPQGNTVVRSAVVSPADGSVKCTWTLDGKVISSLTQATWTFNQLGTYELVFTAERGGAVKTRTTTVTVVEATTAQ